MTDKHKPPIIHGSLSVGWLRKLIKNLPDDAQIYPDWAGEHPGDDSPAVRLNAITAGTDDGKPCLFALVSLVYLNE